MEPNPRLHEDFFGLLSAHCYAETFAERWRGVPGHPYEQGFDLRLVPDKLEEPLHWKKPRRVFVNSMSDLFHEGVPFDFLDKVFAVMGLASQHQFLILTKRPERMRDRPGHPLPNVWLGVSAENQEWFEKRVPILLQCPAAIRFVSLEPLLGPIDCSPFLSRTHYGHCTGCMGRDRMGTHCERTIEHPSSSRIDWIIVGGESGPGARPCQLEWIGGIVKQAKTHGTPVFVKQLGANAKWNHVVPGCSVREHIEVWPLKDPKGGDPSEWPKDLRVREYPDGNSAP